MEKEEIVGTGMDGKLVLEFLFKDYVRLELYDVTGRLMKKVLQG